MKRTFIVTGIFALAVIFTSILPAQNTINIPQVQHTPSKNGIISWSGYVAETSLSDPQSGAVTDVKGNWTVPTVTGSYSSGSGYSCIWVGIDGWTNKKDNQTGTVEQVGTEQDWVKGKAVYYAWYEMYSQPSVTIPFNILPGDEITAEVNYTGGQFVLILADGNKWTFNIREKSNKPLQNSAEWIVEAPWLGKILPLANIGTVDFTNASATINGITGPINDNNWQDEVVITSGATVTVSGLKHTGSPKTSDFSITTQ